MRDRSVKKQRFRYLIALLALKYEKFSSLLSANWYKYISAYGMVELTNNDKTKALKSWLVKEASARCNFLFTVKAEQPLPSIMVKDY